MQGPGTHAKLGRHRRGAVPPAGGWRFRLEELPESVELSVEVGLCLGTADIQADILPSVVRVLIGGRLLQLHLPSPVHPDASQAQRSAASGRLVLRMPKCGRCSPLGPAAPPPAALTRDQSGPARPNGAGAVICEAGADRLALPEPP